MTGAPHAILLRGGAVLGLAATASDKRATPVTLAPGKAAESTLTDFSTCNAQNSDAVRIAAPGQTATVDAPLVLRGCRLEIDPVSALSD